MACCGCSQRQLNSFEVAHLTNKNDVGIFAQRAAQRCCKGFRVQTHFAVIHETGLTPMHELYWIFNSDDMVLARSIRVIHDGGKSRGFTAACRSGYEHQALMQSSKLFDDWRKSQLLCRQYL